MTTPTDSVDRAAVAPEVAQEIETQVAELSSALAILRCVADSLHLAGDEWPHACAALEGALVRIYEARDALEGLGPRLPRDRGARRR